ncbi:MAG TPA: Na+/H+ antiporter NhaA, partial [Polyangiaceae bacterium]|nr:Na+/H+ antiporter NhaA [Polyangiaceae bacterium]
MVRLRRLAKRPIDRFFRIEAASGILLLAAAGAAMVWANSPWAHSYEQLRHTMLGFHVGRFAFEATFEWFVNDVLMAIFFFVVGMEIRREVHDGELSDWRRAALPVAGAVGGMVVPALMYLALARDDAAKPGWGVPMATDIAFAVGVLALLGKRVPTSLRVLLLALAVIDDLGAILVIAFFYSSGIAVSGLAIAALAVAAIYVLRAMGVRQILAYAIPALFVWLGVHSAGIHPTIAGVIVGLATPVRAWLGAEGFVDAARQQAQRVSEEIERGNSGPSSINRPLRRVVLASREAVSPAEFLIDALHPLVAYVIMPVFALINAGVSLHGLSLEGGVEAKVAIAILAALVLGKPIGVIVATWLALASGISVLPSGLQRRHLIVLGIVAGIGFTMSLFIAQLAFSDAALLGAAKFGVLAASAVAMIAGLGAGAAL